MNIGNQHTDARKAGAGTIEDMSPGDTVTLAYLRKSKPIPEGWKLADDLSGTHHSVHAVLIQKVD